MLADNPVRVLRTFVGRAVLAVVAALVALAVTPGTAMALEVHHVFPEDGSVLATAPDHLEIMVDEELQPGLVQMGISPDATDRPVPLPDIVIQDNVAFQPLPPLADGAYTAGFRLLGADGRGYQGTFTFRIDAGAATVQPAPSPDAASPSRNRLIGLVAAGLVVPAVVAVLAGRRRRRPVPATVRRPAGRGQARQRP
jgi:methionine-rich copper-binding protein CopC